jgi:hypothetical protein
MLPHSPFLQVADYSLCRVTSSLSADGVVEPDQRKHDDGTKRQGRHDLPILCRQTQAGDTSRRVTQVIDWRIAFFSASLDYTICGMLRVLSILCLVINTGAGLALAVTRGGFLGQLGLPAPLPFYADLLAVFLVGSGVGFIPAVLNPQQQRSYLWTFGVGVKLVAAMLFARLWFTGMVGWLPGLAAAADATLAVLVVLALRKPAR